MKNTFTAIKLCIGLIVLQILFTGSTISQSLSVDDLKQLLTQLNSEQKLDTVNTYLERWACQEQDKARQLIPIQRRQLAETANTHAEWQFMKHLGTVLYCESNVDSAIYYFHQAGLLAENMGFFSDAGRMQNNVGYLLQMQGKLDSSAFHFQTSIEMASLAKDELLRGSAWMGLGIVNQERGQLAQALTNYQEALKIAESVDNKQLILGAKQNIAVIHYDHFPELLKKSDFLETLAIAREIGDKRNEMGALEFLATMETDSGRHEQAIAYYDEALLVNEKQGDANMNVLLTKGKAKAYANMKEYPRAIQEAILAINYSRDYNVKAELARLHVDLSAYHLAAGHSKQAIQNGKKAIEYAKENNQESSIIDVYSVLAEAYSQQKQYDQAYLFQRSYSELHDSLLNETKSKQLIELETKYETEKKEAEIESLAQQAAIQALELKQKNLAIWVGGILLAVVAVIVYLVYKTQVQRRERAQSELQQRFLRSQLNPHFISNALLAVQNFVLKNEAQAAASYLSKFSKLMREILENSRQEFITVEEELEMLNNYMVIHQMRLNGSFEYEINVDDAIDPEMDTLPPMFVQPFVENAIEHGLINKSQNGKIILDLKKSGDFIQVTLRDNGTGFEESGESSRRSLSTQIIQERIDTFNRSLKNKIQLVVGNEVNENGEIAGAKIELKLPFSYV